MKPGFLLQITAEMSIQLNIQASKSTLECDYAGIFNIFRFGGAKGVFVINLSPPQYPE